MTIDIRTLRPGQVAGFLTPQNADKSGAERQQAEQGGESRKHCRARPVAQPVATPGVETAAQHQNAEEQREKTDEACDVNVLHTSSTSPLSPLKRSEEAEVAQAWPRKIGRDEVSERHLPKPFLRTDIDLRYAP